MSGVVDHVGIRVSDLTASRRLYGAAHGHYVAAFVLDLDRNNDEAVFHG